jgi:hypothetical protein
LILQDEKNKMETRIQRVNNIKKNVETATKRLVKIRVKYEKELKRTKRKIVDR